MDYRSCGWSFLPHTADLHNCESRSAERARRTDLFAVLDTQDPDAVWAWFSREYPSCAKLIPSRRRVRFAEGMICRFHEDGY